ncbi:MAG: P27 family phage terminase small subunit [Thermoanaerobaculia bacterium]
MPAGRPRKPTAQKIAEGTHRKDRDGNRADLVAGGKPQKPDWLNAAAAKFWDRWVPVLVDMQIAKEIDSVELANACFWWDQSHEAAKALAKFKPNHPMYQVVLGSAIATRKQWLSAAAKFGFTPPDRTRIKVEETSSSGVRRRDRKSEK